MARIFNLKKYRTDLGLKQGEIAEVLDVPQSSISAMENGKTTISPQYIEKLQAKYHVTNIDEYYEEIEYVRIENNRGNNNGYKNQLTTGIDPETIANIAEIKKDVQSIHTDFKTRLNKAEEKCERLEADVRELQRQLTAFQVLCARNNLDFDSIINPQNPT